MVTASSCLGPRPTLRAMAQDKGLPPPKETPGRKGRAIRQVLKAESRCDSSEVRNSRI